MNPDSNLFSSHAAPGGSAEEKMTPEMVLAAQLLPVAVPMITPPARLKKSILRTIHSTPRTSSHESVIDVQKLSLSENSDLIGTAKEMHTDFSFYHEDGTGWVAHKHKGIQVKPLTTDKERGYSMVLMRMESGAVYPPHHHDGAEQCFVLSGTVNVHGKELRAGDFHSAATGSDHGAITTTTGNTLLLVIAEDDYRRVYRGMQRNFLKELFLSPYRFLRSLLR
jgi:quercetin dioxygenase-like cupin family protein